MGPFIWIPVHEPLKGVDSNFRRYTSYTSKSDGLIVRSDKKQRGAIGRIRKDSFKAAERYGRSSSASGNARGPAFSLKDVDEEVTKDSIKG
jgi:hypothetical protein